MYFDIVGKTSDDTSFTKEIATLQNKGFNVSCTTEFVENISENEIEAEYKRMGFKRKKNLFNDAKSIS